MLSIRSLGVLQPLLVRPNCEGFEVIAGQRRYHALTRLASEGDIEPVPCIVMSEGDDAKAIEASLAENIARLPMDEIDQHKAFAALIKQGESAEDIAARFGITERLVKQRLAIANIIGPILTAYSKGDIDLQTLRILTMASKKQQKAWLELYRSEDVRAPEGYQLKSWLFGGANIPTENALFDLADYDGNIITDLFGEDSYFDDAEKFWTFQNNAIAEAKERYLAEGWADVVVLDIGEYFAAYDHIDTTKKDGGKVYVRTNRDGEVTFFEGQLSRKEAKAGQDKEDKATKAEKPELTKAMQNYLDLHRHSTVRTKLLSENGIAMRLAAAQIIAGSNLWDVQAEPQKAASEAIEASVAQNKAEAAFVKEREDIAKLLEIPLSGDQTLVPRKHDYGANRDLHAIFAILLTMDDQTVTRILTFAVAETLPCGTAMIDALGKIMNVDMADDWKPDKTFFDLLRDKPTINAMIKEVAGKQAADANITETAKTQKAIIQSSLDGSRKPVKPDWQPRYMSFPMHAYTKQGGIRAVDDWGKVQRHYK